MAKNDRLQGSLDLLVLTTLRRGAMHGFGITTRIQQISEGSLEIEEGSLYPALHRMERDGWISSEWKITENKRRAKYYALTKAGRKQLEQARDQWTRVSIAVALVLEQA